MPQDNLFDDDAVYDGLRITWEQVTLPSGKEWNCEVRRKHRLEGWQTVHVSRWTGLMMDLASTMQEDVLAAFLYDGHRGLAKACVTVVRLAKAHARRFHRVG